MSGFQGTAAYSDGAAAPAHTHRHDSYLYKRTQLDHNQCLALREVQRILMELLNQMDGFDQTVNVKVIMATNRADTLDPALLRPGRLDRKIEFPLPDRRQKRLVFQVSQSLTALIMQSHRLAYQVVEHLFTTSP